MPEENNILKVDDLRHAEYYGMQETFDELYAKSKGKERFTELMSWILSRENILLAYRNIKTNTGSDTAGTDKLTIKDIGKMSAEEVVDKVRFIVKGSRHGYRPKPVRRKDIPKPGSGTRPLGIPCIWDRLIQQCIKQVLEPICEAKFSENSYGFRPNRSVEHAISKTQKLMQISNLHYVIEIDIKGFFDNVNHVKLIKQIWAMGIRDKHLIYIIKQILKAPIKMPDGTVMYPTKGTPQGGIISPLLANIVLNELDHWIESQWQENPVTRNYSMRIMGNGTEDKSNGYRAMRESKLKEMFIIRYADDVRIFCRNKGDAKKVKIAIKQWLLERLKLEVSEEKTRIINVKRRYSEFLGFKIKLQKRKKYTVKSHISNKTLRNQRQKLVEQAKRIKRPRKGKTEYDEIRLYNSMVLGIQNYYKIATNVNLDCSMLQRAVMTVMTNGFRIRKGSRLVKKGRELTKTEKRLFGTSKMLRYIAGTDEPIYPIGYVKHKNPIMRKRSICKYTAEGRKGLHDNLRINIGIMKSLMKQPLYNRSVEYADHRISLFSAQWGKCAVTGNEFMISEDINCHHVIPRKSGGDDSYRNLILVLKPVHKLIHAIDEETINKYRTILNLDMECLRKLNVYRQNVKLNVI